MAGERVLTGTTKYDVEYPREAEVLVREFKCSDQQLAVFFDVDVTTIKRWKDLHPEFNSAIEDVRKVQNAAVERALFDRAIGCKVRQEKIVIPKDGGGPIVAEYNEHLPPDVQAAQFWLKNRDPKNWKDVSKTETQLNVAVVPVINISLKTPGNEK